MGLTWESLDEFSSLDKIGLLAVLVLGLIFESNQISGLAFAYLKI